LLSAVHSRQIAQVLARRNALDLRLVLHAVMPIERDGRHRTARRKLELNGGALGELERGGAFLLARLYARRNAKLQRVIRRAQDVAGHIAQRAAAEIEEAAPIERLIKMAVSIALI